MRTRTYYFSVCGSILSVCACMHVNVPACVCVCTCVSSFLLVQIGGEFVQFPVESHHRTVSPSVKL